MSQHSANVENNAISEQDFVFAYRLLLGRDPEPTALAAIRRELARRPMPRLDLVNSILNSAEFRQRGGVSVPQPFDANLCGQEGFEIYLRAGDPDISDVIRSGVGYEPHVVAAFRDIVQSGAIVLDVGANIGFFTMLAATLVGPKGRVIAVEPLDKNLQLLQRSALRNRFRQVEVLPFAAGPETGTVAMQTTTRTTNAESKRDPGHEAGSAFAPVRALDGLLTDLERLDLVKIDIEGFEPLAWKGLQRTLARLRPAVISEFHPQAIERNSGCKAEQYVAELLAYAGQLFVLERHGSRAACRGVEDVMEAWRKANKQAGMDGIMHLDLLVKPQSY